MSLKGAIRAAQYDLPITRIHEQWLVDYGIDPVWSEQALEFARRDLSNEVGGQRKNRKRLFRASSAGKCERKQLFVVSGVQGEGEDLGDLANVLNTGKFLHLKWQMMGLTAGWLKEAEVPVERLDLNAGGTLDGKKNEKVGWEFKSAHSKKFSSVMTYGPMDEHIFQIDHYMHLDPQIEVFSLVYEDKDKQLWREYRVDKDEKRDAVVAKTLDRLNNNLADRTMPAMQPACELKEGLEFRRCPFRKICPKVKTGSWPAT